MTVYDLIADRRTVKIKAHEDDINSCCWADTASGNVLVSASDDTFLKVWYVVGVLEEVKYSISFVGIDVLSDRLPSLQVYSSDTPRASRTCPPKVTVVTSSRMARTKCSASGISARCARASIGRARRIGTMASRTLTIGITLGLIASKIHADVRV